MREFLHRHVLIPAFETVVKGRKTFAYWRELERSQWESTEELERRQLESLRKLLVHASANCPYYRDAWKERGLDPASVRSLADFEKWPLVGRDEIRAHRKEMRASAPEMRMIRKTTGGSSGTPLEFDHDIESNDRRMAATFRGYGWAGAAPGTLQWYLWGGAVGKTTRWKRTKDALYHQLYRRRMASSFELSDARIPEYLEQLERCRPDSIVAYTNPLYEFARVLEERRSRPFSPRSIIVGAEKLHDFQRELIERVFRAPVFETYGSREFMLIAAECEHHAGLHLTIENHVVEILDDEGRATPPGEEGNVVITDLTNRGMPFIRYPNGDRAVAGFEKCKCGRGLPLLKKVVGRRLDMVETPDGRHVPGEFFPHLVKEFSAIRRFQVIQEDPETVRLQLVVGPGWTAADQRTLEQQIGDVTGPAVRIEISLVDDIPLTPAGKLQVVIRRPRGRSPASELIEAEVSSTS